MYARLNTKKRRYAEQGGKNAPKVRKKKKAGEGVREKKPIALTSSNPYRQAYPVSLTQFLVF